MVFTINKFIKIIIFWSFCSTHFVLGAVLTPQENLNIAIDLDGTLVYHHAHMQNDAIILGIPYGFAHGAVELLAALHEMKATLTFYSAGSHDRNTFLISRLIQEVEKKAGRKISEYTILSRDLIPIEGTKNLNLLVSRNLDLNRTILIDDNPTVAYENQRRNLLRLDFDMMDIMQTPENPCSEPDQIEQIQLKNNLVRATGLLLKAIEVAQHKKIHLVDALSDLQWEERYLHEETHDKSIYRLGLTALREINPDFQLYTELSFFSDKILYPW